MRAVSQKWGLKAIPVPSRRKRIVGITCEAVNATAPRSWSIDGCGDALLNDLGSKRAARLTAVRNPDCSSSSSDCRDDNRQKAEFLSCSRERKHEKSDDTEQPSERTFLDTGIGHKASLGNTI